MAGKVAWKIGGMAALFAGIIVALSTAPAGAHCDSMDGPVVIDAKAALEAGNVEKVLKWVDKEDEAEVRAAFERTLKVRALGEDAKNLADTWFFETLVRLHRASEGAPYTGLKPAGEPLSPVVAKAEDSLAKGSVDDFAGLIGEHAAKGVRERFNRVIEAMKHKDANVEAGRKFVAEYVEFIHYVENLHGAVMGHGAHHDE